MAHRTVLLKGDFTLGRNEFKAGEAGIYPGCCLEFDSSGDVVLNNTAGLPTHGMLIALENDLNGDEVGTVYVDDTQVQCYYARPGDLVALRVKTSENIAIGDLITIDNAGDFVENATTGYTTVAVALEAAGALTVDTLVKCIIVAPNSTYA